jgi:hypothetical protein
MPKPESKNVISLQEQHETAWKLSFLPTLPNWSFGRKREVLPYTCTDLGQKSLPTAPVPPAIGHSNGYLLHTYTAFAYGGFNRDVSLIGGHFLQTDSDAFYIALGSIRQKLKWKFFTGFSLAFWLSSLQRLS